MSKNHKLLLLTRNFFFLHARHWWAFRSSVITAFTDNQVCLLRSVKLFSKSQSNISCRICGPWKASSLILASQGLRNFLFKERKPSFLSIALITFFTMPSFTCNGGSKIFPQKHYNVGLVLCFPRCIKSNSVLYSQITIREESLWL